MFLCLFSKANWSTRSVHKHGGWRHRCWNAWAVHVSLCKCFNYAVFCLIPLRKTEYWFVYSCIFLCFPNIARIYCYDFDVSSVKTYSEHDLPMSMANILDGVAIHSFFHRICFFLILYNLSTQPKYVLNYAIMIIRWTDGWKTQIEILFLVCMDPCLREVVSIIFMKIFCIFSLINLWSYHILFWIIFKWNFTFGQCFQEICYWFSMQLYLCR